MKATDDSTSPAINVRVEAKRSVTSIAFSLLATCAGFLGAGAAMASPSSMIPGDALLAFHGK
ncbi:hypothetical protein [Mycobacterium sp.]|uniref:hypothetical protein n=1 Tax=Mycobacterium sp. TaxID=1785 RepID=UPI003D130E3A